jgi:hypothetical protein
MTSLYGLIRRIRSEFTRDDEGDETSYLWRSSNIANALNAAEKEIARRTLMISDSSSAICSLPLTAVNGEFPQSLPISSKVVRVRYVLFPHAAGQGYRELKRSSTDRLNQQSQWQWIGRRGQVGEFVTDFERLKLTFGHQPISGGTVKIGVYRLPLNDMVYNSADDAKNVYPEIQEHDETLIHGALKHLYLKEDEGAYDVQRSNTHSALFEVDLKILTQEIAAMEPQETITRAEVW